MQVHPCTSKPKNNNEKLPVFLLKTPKTSVISIAQRKHILLITDFPLRRFSKKESREQNFRFVM